MLEMVFLLLPVAAASGWFAAKRYTQNQHAQQEVITTRKDNYIQGFNYLLNDQSDKALDVFNKIVELDSNAIEIHFVLGNLFRRRGEVDRAIWIHRNLIARPNLENPHKASALLELGRDYLKAGLLDSAERVFHDVTRTGIHDVDAYQHLIELYEQEKDWESAITSSIELQCRSGKSQVTRIAQYYCELGQIKIDEGRSSRAEELAVKAISFDPNCSRASILLGDVAFARADYLAAIEYYGNVYKQNSNHLCIALPKLKLAYERRDNDVTGYLEYLHCIRKGPCYHSALSGIIESYMAQGNVKAVEALFKAEFTKQKIPLSLIGKYVSVLMEGDVLSDGHALSRVADAIESYLNSEVSHQCQRCGLKSRGLFWQCPSCHGWSTMTPLSGPEAVTH